MSDKLGMLVHRLTALTMPRSTWIAAAEMCVIFNIHTYIPVILTQKETQIRAVGISGVDTRAAASSTLGRNDSDMKGQPHRASGVKITTGSAQKNICIRPFYSRDTLRVCLRVHCITWVGFT